MAVRMADPARYAPDLLGFYPQERQIDRRYEMTGVNPYAMNADRYVSGLLTDPMARAEFGTGLLQGATTDLAAAPVDIYASAVDMAQDITPQNNQFNYYTNPFWMLSQSGDIAQKAQSVAGSEALGEAVYGKPPEGYGMYRNPARVVGGVTGAGELALGKVSAEVAPYVARGINYLTDAIPRPQAVTPEGLLMDTPQQAPTQPQTLLMEGDNVPSATQTVDNVPIPEPAQVVPPTDENPVGIIAFHGSGADFDEFKLEKIGTGEGAQAYGYGLYFTDSEDIAKFYRNTVQFDQAMRGKATIKYKGEVFEDLGDTAAAEAAPPSYNAIKSIAEEMNKITGTFGKQTGLKKSPAEAAKDRVLSRINSDLSGIEQSIKDFKANPQVYPLKFKGMELDPDIADSILADLQQQKQAVLEINADDIEIATGKIYKVSIEPKPEELLDYDLPIGEQPEQIKVALIKALEDINDPELNANIMLEARAAKEKQEAVVSLNKELDDFSDSLPNQESKETFAKLRELLIDKKHKWSAMVNRADMEEERRLFEELTKAVPYSKYPDIDPNIIYDIQRSLRLASPKSIGSFLPTDKKTADALSNAGIKGIKYRAAGSRSADVDDVAAERNYVIFDDKLIKIMEKYGIPAGVSVTAVKGAMQDTDDGLLAKDGQQPQGLL